MPLGTTGAAFKAAVESTAYRRVVQVTVTLPVVGALTFGVAPLGCVQALSFEEGDQSSYPSDLIDQSGLTNVAGSVTLGGRVTVSGSPITVTRLFNPNDTASPLYRQDISDSPITVSTGVVDANGIETVDRSGFVTTVEVQQSAGLVVVNWSDVPAGFEALPEMNAVLVSPPWNAGLTSEFVMDRIARAASGGAISSWPAQRSQCVFAAGLRTSLWPEVGTLLGTLVQPVPVFAAGAFGSGLSSYANSGGTSFVNPQYSLAGNGVPINGSVFIEMFVSNLTATIGVDPLNGVQLVTAAGAANNVYLLVTTSGLRLSLNNGTALTWSTPIDTGVHYVAVQVTLPGNGGTSAAVKFWLDGTTHTGTATTPFAFDGHALDTVDLVLGDGVYAGVQVTTESSPTGNNGFTPSAVFDPSLNPLQAVPAIDAGANGFDELQSVAEAELGWIGFRDGVLTFLNRDSIVSAASSRTVTAQASLMDMQSATVGGSTVYDDIAIDYTEYQFGSDELVYSPKKALKVPANSTVTITRTLPDGLTVGSVDQSFIYQSADTSNPGVNQSVFRASADVNGVSEIPDTSKLSGTVSTVTPSQIQISLTNRSGADMWMVSPSNYTAIPVGTPSVWINGVPVTPDDPSIIHVNAGTQTSTYQVPSNGYRQDRDATIATGKKLLRMLQFPMVLYGQVDMVPDPRVTVPDRVTLDIPVDGGVTPMDVFVWGNSVSATFDADGAEWSQQLDVRAAVPAGAWDLGESVLGTGTYLY